MWQLNLRYKPPVSLYPLFMAVLGLAPFGAQSSSNLRVEVRQKQSDVSLRGILREWLRFYICFSPFFFIRKIFPCALLLRKLCMHGRIDCILTPFTVEYQNGIDAYT